MPSYPARSVCLLVGHWHRARAEPKTCRNASTRLAIFGGKINPMASSLKILLECERGYMTKIEEKPHYLKRYL